MSAGMMPKWLGFKLGESLNAIALESVLRVYHHPAANGSAIEAYEGYPVFIVPAAAIFAEQALDTSGLPQSLFNSHPATSQMNWVVVLKSDEASKIGFRVEKTFGPFVAEANKDEPTVRHEEMILHVVKPIGGMYG